MQEEACRLRRVHQPRKRHSRLQSAAAYWFLLICSIRSVNSLRKRWHSCVFSKVLDVMASHTGSAILGTEYKLQMVPLQKRRYTELSQMSRRMIFV